MVSPAFIAQRWPQRNSDYVVEECEAIRAGRDAPRLYADSPVYAVKRGASLTRCFECPGCGKLVETLYRPPAYVAEPVDWQSELGQLGFACRWCHRLVYASQRYGPNHPLRQVLTARKRRHQGFGKPYLNRRSVMRRALRALAEPEPTNWRRWLRWADPILDADALLALRGVTGDALAG